MGTLDRAIDCLLDAVFRCAHKFDHSISVPFGVGDQLQLGDMINGTVAPGHSRVVLRV
jgi:hypothetical protein